ncbi:MAG: hypothetical protein JO057_28975, partial [Chloroflexi bacterium]|nr:hypothetical protein [Chloroflexota bacterium]
MAPWAVVVLIGAVLIGVLPSAQAQTGSSAADAIPIGTDGHFAGTAPASSSLWYKFNYNGGGQQVTTTLNFQPPDSTRLDLFYFTGDPNNPTQYGLSSSLDNNTRTISYTDPGGPRNVFIKVENDHPDRSVSFVGSLSPTSAIATPTATPNGLTATPQVTPTAGPVAGSATSAILITDNSGVFSGTIGPNQAVWYRVYYGNPGADMTISFNISPTADNADMNVFSGTDPNNLASSQQSGSQVRNSNVISRHVNFPSAQYVFVSLGNNGSIVQAYGGSINPFTAPPTTVTPTPATPVATGTTTAGPTSTPAPVPTAVPVAHDQQYYAQTGF